jgi:hypothetical protein
MISGFAKALPTGQTNKVIPKTSDNIPLVRITPKADFFNLAPPLLESLSLFIEYLRHLSLVQELFYHGATSNGEVA